VPSESWGRSVTDEHNQMIVNNSEPRPARKPWQAPRVILSEHLAGTNNGGATTTDTFPHERTAS
jgi:hypothetical protein